MGLLEKIRNYKLGIEIGELKSEIKKHPNKLKLWKRLGDLYMKSNQNNRASFIYLKVGDAFKEKGFYEKASCVYKQALMADAHWHEPHERLAELYHEQNLLKEALIHYQRVTSLLERQGEKEKSQTYARIVSDLMTSLNIYQDAPAPIPLKAAGNSPISYPHHHEPIADLVDLSKYKKTSHRR
jgi:tetratricopeptide (TPR) repeat protein